jgi:hypothetical protein
MKHNSPVDWDWEKKPRKVQDRDTKKAGKHRKSIYNMLSDYEDDESEFDSEDGEVKRNYATNYYKQR